MKTKNLLPLAAAVMLFGLTVMLQACSDESDDPIPAGWIYWDDDPDPNDTTLVRDYLIFDGFFMVKPNLVYDYRCIQVFPDITSSVWVWRSCSDTIPGYAELMIQSDVPGRSSSTWSQSITAIRVSAAVWPTTTS